MELSAEEWNVLRQTKLFAGIEENRLEDMLSCLNAYRKDFSAGTLVVREGEQVSDVGLVLSGHARSLKLSDTGEPLIISLLERGSFLGVLLAASRDRKSPVAVQAQEPLSVLFFPAERLIFPCEKACGDHAQLLRSFLDCVAEKSLTLNDRIDCLIRRSVREKVTAYLSRLSAERSAREFTIPLDRNALANYLNVERSALSRELSRMRADGLIEYRKNYFRLVNLF